MSVASKLLAVSQGTKEGKKSTTKTSSDAVEAARVDMCEAMYKDLSDCNSRFYKNPALSAPYFNWEVLRPGEQNIFSITIAAQVTKLLAKRTLAPGEVLKVTNNTDVPVEIGCTDKGGGIDQKATVPPHSVANYTAAQIDNSKATPLIVVMNAQTLGIAHLMVEIVKVG